MVRNPLTSTGSSFPLGCGRIRRDFDWIPGMAVVHGREPGPALHHWRGKFQRWLQLAVRRRPASLETEHVPGVGIGGGRRPISCGEPRMALLLGFEWLQLANRACSAQSGRLQAPRNLHIGSLRFPKGWGLLAHE